MGFIAGEVAIEIGAKVKPLYEAIKKRDADLADQIYRATKSLVLNAPEGGKRGGKDRNYHFRIAAGSTAELQAALRFAESWGFIEKNLELHALIDRELALLWRLEHPR